MMIQYFTVDGQLIIENSKVNARYMEMRDGYHPITNDSVWQDAKRLRKPIMVIFEGVLGPLGSDMAEKDVKGIILEMELIKRSHRKQSISRMWARALARMFDFVVKRGIPALLLVFVAYFVVQGMLAGV